MNQLLNFQSPSPSSATLVERRAVIDVGTNSVKLLVADVGFTLKPVLRLSLQTSLGQGAFRTGRLRPEAIARTADAVAQFASEAVELGCNSIQVVATSAARDTANGNDLVQAIRIATELSVDVISGEQEAEYVFEGVTSDPLMGSYPTLIVKVGGGSAEWIVAEYGRIVYRKSSSIGTLRLLEFQPLDDSPTQADLALLRAAAQDIMRAEISPSLTPALRALRGRTVRLVGLGSSLQALAQLSSKPAASALGQPVQLHREQLLELLERLWRLSRQERQLLGGLDPQKADLIMSAAVVYERVMSEFGFDEMLVSSRGFREGMLLVGPAKTVFHRRPGVADTLRLAYDRAGT